MSEPYEMDYRVREVDYSRTPHQTPRWGWVDLWVQANPQPENGEDFAYWYELKKIESRRALAAAVFPQFDVWDWSPETLQHADALMRHLVCGVCGRIQDSACIYGC